MLLLAVSLRGAVLAEIVAVEQMLTHAAARRVEGGCVVGHASYGFKDDRVVCGIRRCDAPGERRVASNQHRRNGKRIDVLKTPNDRVTGVQHIVATHLIRGQLVGYGNGTVKVVGVSSP